MGIRDGLLQVVWPSQDDCLKAPASTDLMVRLLGVPVHPEEFLALLSKTCRERKIPLLGVVFPYFKSDGEYADVEEDDRRALLDGLKRHGIDHLDLHACFPSEKRRLYRQSEEDFLHPTDEGQRVAAGCIHEYLSERLLKTGT